MKFIIQTFDGKIEHDFAFILLKAINYWNWKHQPHEKIGDCVKEQPDDIIEYCLREELFGDTYYTYETKAIEEIERNWMKEYCPIGSVEFVQSYYQWVWGFEPIKPKNVPFVLWEYTNRTIGEFYDSKQLFNAYDDFSDKVFVKCMNEIKSHRNGVINKEMLRGWDNIQVSDLINIDSEYRCFVMNNELLGIHHYSGDFTIFPNLSEIEKIINVYSKSKNVPVAYTLDIGLSQKIGFEQNYRGMKNFIPSRDGDVLEEKIFVIEVHDFFSCGLYGFNNLDKLPLMFWRWHKEHIKNNTNE